MNLRMFEMWCNGQLLGYFRVPDGYDPIEWVAQYNTNLYHYKARAI